MKGKVIKINNRSMLCPDTISDLEDLEKRIHNLFYDTFDELKSIPNPSREQMDHMLLELKELVHYLTELNKCRDIKDLLLRGNRLLDKSKTNQVFYDPDGVAISCSQGVKLKEELIQVMEECIRFHFLEPQVKDMTLSAQQEYDYNFNRAVKLLHELNKCREPHKSNCYTNYSDPKKTECSFDGSIEDGFKEYCAKISSSEYENYYVYESANLEKLYGLFEKSIKEWVILEHSTTYPLMESNFVNTWGLVSIGLILIMFGLYIKLALAPAHLWSLKVYQGSPISSVFFFSVISKISVFSLLIRLFYTNAAHLSEIWFYYSAVISVLSIFIGALGGFKQRRLKALLAYSSTNHMGYILLGFNSNTFECVKIILFYFIIYMISGICLWTTLLLLSLIKKKISYDINKELSDTLLLKKSNNILGFSLMLAVFSMAGIPPMSGFLAKISVFLKLNSSTSVSNSIVSVVHKCLLTKNKKRFFKNTCFSRHVYLKSIRFGFESGVKKSVW